MKVKEILVVRKLNKNLLTVSKLAKDNSCTLEFNESDFVVKDKKTGNQLVRGSKKRGLYALEDNDIFARTASSDWKKDWIWHAKLGHPSLKS